MGAGHGHHDHDHAHEPAHEHGAPADAAGHDHSGHDHQHDLRETPINRLIGAFIITAGFMFVEAGVGWWTRSLALLADAGHMLADAAALGLAIIAQRIASQARTRARTYGHRRAEVLAAFGNGVALAVTAIWIFIEAVGRWREPVSIQAGPMTITAVVGLLVNIASAMMLGLGQKGHNMNTRGALAHVLTDALGSVAAIVAGVLVITMGWTRADPALSAVIGVLVLWGGYRLVRETTRVLMEGSPIEIDIADVEKTICGVEGVAALHDLHVWSISDGFNVLTVHVVLKNGFHGVEVALAVVRRLREVHKIDHATVQPEPARSEQLVALRIPSKNRPAA